MELFRLLFNEREVQMDFDEGSKTALSSILMYMIFNDL